MPYVNHHRAAVRQAAKLAAKTNSPSPASPFLPDAFDFTAKEDDNLFRLAEASRRPLSGTPEPRGVFFLPAPYFFIGEKNPSAESLLTSTRYRPIPTNHPRNSSRHNRRPALAYRPAANRRNRCLAPRCPRRRPLPANRSSCSPPSLPPARCP